MTSFWENDKLMWLFWFIFSSMVFANLIIPNKPLFILGLIGDLVLAVGYATLGNPWKRKRRSSDETGDKIE